MTEMKFVGEWRETNDLAVADCLKHQNEPGNDAHIAKPVSEKELQAFSLNLVSELGILDQAKKKTVTRGRSKRRISGGKTSRRK